MPLDNNESRDQKIPPVVGENEDVLAAVCDGDRASVYPCRHDRGRGRDRVFYRRMASYESGFYDRSGLSGIFRWLARGASSPPEVICQSNRLTSPVTAAPNSALHSSRWFWAQSRLCRSRTSKAGVGVWVFSWGLFWHGLISAGCKKGSTHSRTHLWRKPIKRVCKCPLAVYFRAAFRYLLIGVAVYVIFKVLNVPVLSMIIGLCALGAATFAISVHEILHTPD